MFICPEVVGVQGGVFSRQYGTTFSHFSFILKHILKSLKHFNLLTIVNIWYSFHLNINMPFEKSRTNENQESLYGNPTSFCWFPEAMREMELKWLSLWLYTFLFAQYHSLLSNDMCEEKEMFSLTLTAASTCTGLTASGRTQRHTHSSSQSLGTDSGSTARLSQCPAMHSYIELIVLIMTK